MSTSGQDFGFDTNNLFVAGKTFPLRFIIPNLLAGDVASMEWAFFRLPPVQTTQQSALITKTNAAGLTLVDGADGLEVNMVIDPTDTVSLAGAIYFHRLDFVETTGEERESARGRAKLTPRV